MRALFSLDGEHKLLRNVLFLALGCVAIFVGAAQGISRLTDPGLPAPAGRIAASGETRTYTVTRSVLDGPLTTASIGDLNKVRLDPCKR